MNKINSAIYSYKQVQVLYGSVCYDICFDTTYAQIVFDHFNTFKFTLRPYFTY